ARPFVGLAVAGPGDVIDFLEALTVLRPTLDDLNTIEIGRGRVLYRPHDEARGRALFAQWHGRQVSAHRDAAFIGSLHPIAGVDDVLVEAPPAEKAHLDVRAADAEGLLAIHGVPDGSACVLLCPHSGQPAGVFQANVHGAADENASKTPFDRTVGIGMKAEEIVLPVRAGAIV